MKEYDIAIIGAGIAGLYCCMKANPDKKVVLFEATDRIGGRIETVKMDVFNAEYGAMRFDPIKQPMLRQLISELNLELDNFYEYSSPPIYNIRTKYNLDEEEKGLTTLQLMNLGLQRIFNKNEEELLSMTDEEIEYIKRNGKYKGEYLWKQGLWNIFSDVLSFDAIKCIIMEGSFYHFIHENPGIADWGTTWIKLFQMSKYLKCVKNGMNLITDEMLNKIIDNIEIYKNHVLQEISEQDDDIILRFVKDNNNKDNNNFIELDKNNFTEVKTKSLILAIPPRSLKKINLPNNIKNLLDSVIEIPLIKCFFVVKNPWWRENIPNVGTIPFPTREMHYYKQDGKGNVMIYADRPFINLWSRYINCEYHPETEINSNKNLPKTFAKCMNINPDDILMYGIRDWGREPYSAACHMWKHGVKSWEISQKLESFSLSGNKQNVHICGEAFSDFQGFLEGSIRSANNVMEQINSPK